MKHLNYCEVVLLLVLTIFLAACSSSDDDEIVKMEDQVTELGAWQHIGTGRMIKVLDVTANYETVYYQNGVANRTIDVEHVSYDKMPEGLRETLKIWGMSGDTKVFRFKYKNEMYYHMLAWFYDYNVGIYKPSGEQLKMSLGDYIEMIEGISEVKCVMVLRPENVMNAEGAPNLLVGTWQNDWEHAHYLADYERTYADTIVSLHPDFDFNIAQICSFDANGQGCLYTIRRDKGDPTVYTDRFRYEINDYYRWLSGYPDTDDYIYTCYYEGGDTIQYRARMREGARKFDHTLGTSFSYPWFRKGDEGLNIPEGIDGGFAYATPSKQTGNPIVGKWTGYYYEDSQMPTHVIIWVFRDDDTGYWLIDKIFQQSFAYNNGYTNKEADGSLYYRLKCYNYDANFLSFDATEEPEERVAKFSSDEDEMTLSDIGYIDGYGKYLSVIFHRVKN